MWGLGFGIWGFGFRVWGLGFWSLGFRVEGLGFEVWGLGFGVWGLGSRLPNPTPGTSLPELARTWASRRSRNKPGHPLADGISQ